MSNVASLLSFALIALFSVGIALMRELNLLLTSLYILVLTGTSPSTTALMLAAQLPHEYNTAVFESVLAASVEQGGSVNLADQSGMSALMHAVHTHTAQLDHLAFVEALLARGATVATQDWRGRSSALHLAPNRRSISSRPPRPFGLLSFGTFQPICSRSPMQDMPKRCPQTQCQDIFARVIRALGADHTEVIATIVRRRCPVGQIDKHPSFRREYPIRNRRK